MPEINEKWIKEQMQEAKVKVGVGNALLKLLATWEQMKLSDPQQKEVLALFDKYKLTGSGFKSEHIRNIKDEFAIIDGEIQAGNNNPQLMRDARKMLKEMVTKKLVTLYEAQIHMKHLRKINKI